MARRKFRNLVLRSLNVLGDVSMQGAVAVGGNSMPNLFTGENLFWVDPTNGSDTVYNGLSRDKPFKTQQVAIDLCDDWDGSVIICKKGTQTVTEPVEYNVKGLTVIAENMGIPSRAAGERFMVYGSHTDGPAAIISRPCKIIGMGFCGSEAAGGSLEVDGTTGGFDGGNFASLLNVRFSHWGIAKAYALILQGTGDIEIGNCYFDGYTAGYTTAAIECQLAGASGSWAAYIHDCLFMNPVTYCLKMATGAVPVRGLVEHNFHVGTGKFFNANSVSGSWIFADNYLPTATDTSSYNDTVDNLQSAGYQFINQHYPE